MVLKNWKAISECGNEQLRMALIASKGEIVEGLATGFPQYFLAEDASIELPTREKLLELVRESGQRDSVIQMLKDLGLPHQRFSFSGSNKGSTDGVSYSKGGYDTVANGWGEYFYRSTKKPGEVVEHESAQWLVVWNGYSSGSPYSFAYHTLIIVPVEALKA